MQRLEPTLSNTFSDDSPSPNQLRDTLEREWCEGGELEQIADEASRSIRHDHRAGLRKRLQPRRQVGCLSSDTSLLRLPEPIRSPTTTSPVAISTRALSGSPPAVLSCPMLLTSERPALTARSASSSWACG